MAEIRHYHRGPFDGVKERKEEQSIGEMKGTVIRQESGNLAVYFWRSDEMVGDDKHYHFDFQKTVETEEEGSLMVREYMKQFRPDWVKRKLEEEGSE